MPPYEPSGSGRTSPGFTIDHVWCVKQLNVSVCFFWFLFVFVEIAVPDPIDVLPRSKCEEALRIARQARWFEVITILARVVELTALYRVVKNNCFG